MRVVVAVVFLGSTYLGLGSLLNAQIAQPIIPLELQGAPRETQLSPYLVLAKPQCDDSGTVYVRYSTETDPSAPSTLASIQSDGTTQTLKLQLGDASDPHVFLFTAANDGSLHEIVRVPDSSDQDQPSSSIRYVSFDADGSLRSESTFAGEFIPSLAAPLPDGSFFASGVTLHDSSDGIQEKPVVGVFNSDAKLSAPLTADAKRTKKTTGNAIDDQELDTAFDGGIAKVASDGMLYLLLPGDHVKVAVVNESGRISREMTLQEPFQTDVAHDLWVSGNRVLVAYEGEADTPGDAYVYVLYDRQTGDVVRVYRPEFAGTVACFEDGQTLTVLLQDQSSGKVSLGTAELQ